jgi:predicted tellurium resistance membrane protein TerC
MSPKTWVILTGGILGIITMRLVIGQLIAVVERYPALVDGAFIIIAWVGIKLVAEYLHSAGYVHFEIPKWFSLGLIVVIFAISFWYARNQEGKRLAGTDEAAKALLSDEANPSA